MGGFARGGYRSTPSLIQTRGVIRPTNAEDLEQLPEGDRVQGMMTFWSPIEIKITGTKGTSDIINYHGSDYRVLQVMDSGDAGFWKAIGTRMSGE